MATVLLRRLIKDKGEQLESIDRLRQRASEAHDLILYYNEFALGDISRLETMRKEGGKEGRGKVALAAKRLMSLAKEVEGLEGAELVRPFFFLTYGDKTLMG